MATLARHPYSRLAVAGFVLGMVSVLFLLLAGPGYRLGLWDFRTGFVVLRWGAYLAVPALALSLAGSLVARPGRRRRGLGLGVAGLVLALVAVAVPALWLHRAQQVPRIHDISTDLENPPRFVAILPLRAGATNTAEHGGAELAALQRQGYPDLGPARLDRPKDEVFDAALAAARELGWRIVAADPAAGRIEATDTTFWFGFKDDVVVRIAEEDGGTRVDLRSVSRVGISDAGTNAARIRALLRELQGSD